MSALARSWKRCSDVGVGAALLALLAVLASWAVSPVVRSADPIPTTTTVIVPSGWTWGTIQFEATVSPAPTGGSTQPKVTFVWPDDPLAGPTQVSLDSSGHAVAYMGGFAPGDHRVYVDFPGHGDYEASRSATATVKVGEGTSIELTITPKPVISPNRPTVTARLMPTSIPIGGGELILESNKVGELGRVAVTEDQRVLQVQPSLPVGENRITAHYTGYGLHRASMASQLVDVVIEATAVVTPDVFYPVQDGYYDRLEIRGTRSTRVAVDVLIRNDSTRTVVHELSAPAGTGDYHISWNGRLTNGELVPPGRYDVVVWFDAEDGGDQKWVGDTVFVKHDWVSWKKKTIALPGEKFRLWGWTKDARISMTKSAWSGGVRLASNKGFAVVVYKFSPIVKSPIYGLLNFQVQGRSTNRHRALVALWKPKLGAFTNLGNYDAARKIGPGFKWWRTSAHTASHRKNRTAYGAVMVWKGLGRPGKAVFDIRRVKVTYKVGTLHSATGASLAGSDMERELRAMSQRGEFGRPMSVFGGAGDLPPLVPAPTESERNASEGKAPEDNAPVDEVKSEQPPVGRERELAPGRSIERPEREKELARGR